MRPLKVLMILAGSFIIWSLMVSINFASTVIEDEDFTYNPSVYWPVEYDSNAHGGKIHWNSVYTNGYYGQVSFTGNRVKLFSRLASNNGKADIYIDDVKVDTVDLYNATTSDQYELYDSGEIASSNHTIKIVQIHQKNASSTSYRINIDYIEVYEATAAPTPTWTATPTDSPTPTVTPTPLPDPGLTIVSPVAGTVVMPGSDYPSIHVTWNSTYDSILWKMVFVISKSDLTIKTITKENEFVDGDLQIPYTEMGYTGEGDYRLDYDIYNTNGNDIDSGFVEYTVSRTDTYSPGLTDNMPTPPDPETAQWYDWLNYYAQMILWFISLPIQLLAMVVSTIATLIVKIGTIAASLGSLFSTFLTWAPVEIKLMLIAVITFVLTVTAFRIMRRG